MVSYFPRRILVPCIKDNPIVLFVTRLRISRLASYVPKEMNQVPACLGFGKLVVTLSVGLGGGGLVGASLHFLELRGLILVPEQLGAMLIVQCLQEDCGICNRLSPIFD